MKASVLAESLLRDRAARAARPRVVTRTNVDRVEFDPFAVTRWRVIANGEGYQPNTKGRKGPRYLPKTKMRRGPVGWFIDCHHCGAEFESKGWAYCPACMELPAEVRRDKPAPSARQCQACGGMISGRSRVDAKFCSLKCKKRLANARSYGG